MRAHRPLHLIGLIPALWAALALSACAVTAPAPTKEFVVADLFATPGKLLATVELSPTVIPTATYANVAPPTLAPTLPLPTVVVLSQPTQPLLGMPTQPYRRTPTPIPPAVSCPQEPPLPFLAVWQNTPGARDLMRCPAGLPQTVGGVYQSFERGIMFWRESDKSIFAISNAAIMQGQPTDKWWRLADLWRDGMPDGDPSLQPPAGLRQPVRGFGLAWRSNGFVREALGWATSDEQRIDSQWLTFEGGWMMTGPSGSPIFVMIPLDAPPYSNGNHLPPVR